MWRRKWPRSAVGCSFEEKIRPHRHAFGKICQSSHAGIQVLRAAFSLSSGTVAVALANAIRASIGVLPFVPDGTDEQLLQDVGFAIERVENRMDNMARKIS